MSLGSGKYQGAAELKEHAFTFTTKKRHRVDDEGLHTWNLRDLLTNVPSVNLIIIIK